MKVDRSSHEHDDKLVKLNKQLKTVIAPREAEALQVIDAIVTCYTEAMVEHHEASKYPPVRGMTPTPDPMTPSAANPFADLEDDLPWEEPKGKKP